MENSTNEILEKIHSRLGWIAFWLFLMVLGVGQGIYI
tara:strand:+ start:2529 stop:2639 length:111 start_codon:yes stop_codon:yes gene_type:complete